jgi:hypothetical protein
MTPKPTPITTNLEKNSAQQKQMDLPSFGWFKQHLECPANTHLQPVYRIKLINELLVWSSCCALISNETTNPEEVIRVLVEERQYAFIHS